MRAYVKPIVFLILTMVFLALSTYYSARLDSFNNKIYYVNEAKNTAVSASQALENQKQKDKFSPVTYWGKKGKMAVSSPALDSSVTAEIVAVCGRTDLLFSPGVWLDYDQQDRCLLGYDTAAQLFGSRNVVGLKAELDGKSFQVAGVLPQVKDCFAYEVKSSDTVLFDRMTVGCGGSSRQFVKNQVAGQYSDSVELDFELLLFFSRILMLLVPFIIIGTPLRLLGKNKWIGYAVLFILLVKIIEFPSSLIPPKWSDFSFWSTLWQAKREGLLLFLREAMAAPDLVFFQPYGKMMLCCLISVFCCLLMMGYMRKEEVLSRDHIRTYWKNLWKKYRRSGRFQSGDQ